VANPFTKLLLVSFAASVLGACGPAAKQPAGPVGEPGVLPAVSGLSQGTEGVTYELPSAAAERYRTDPLPAEPRDGLAGRLVVRLGEAGAGKMLRDGRLDRAAEVVLQAEQAGVEINTDVVRRILWWSGVPEASPTVGLFSGSGDADQEQRVLTAIAERAAQDHRLLGLAQVPITGGTRILVITLLGGIGLEPVPGRLSPGDTLELEGSFEPPHDKVGVTATAPGGGVIEVDTAVAGRRFQASFEPDRIGRWQVELLADGPRGPWVLANFPVAVGVERETSVTSLEFELESREPQEIEELLFRALNGSRVEHDLAPVTRSSDLDRVCRAYSEEMAGTGQMGHVSPISGDPGDRVAAAGLFFSRLKENLARAHSAAEAHMGLMRSPAHRANILDPMAVEAGVGAAVVADPDGDAIYVTELIVARPEPVDPAEAAEVAFERVNTLRGEAGLKRVKRHSWLDGVARDQLVGCFDDAKSPAVQLKGSPFTGVAALTVATASLSKILSSATGAVVKAEYTHLGVAVRQGDHPKLGKETICIQLVFGKKR
jgi:uncharacterized protein YkwD